MRTTLAEDSLAAWYVKARPNQIEPAGDWLTWLLQAGRGFGKTRTGAEWGQEKGLVFPGSRIAIVAPTFQDARDTCIEGDSGLLSVLPDGLVSVWNRSLGELVLTNGTRYKLFSADKPDRLRGPQHHFAWCDELSSWQYEDALDQLMFGLRLGDSPRICVTTTPKPNPITRRLVKASDTVITRGSTFDNAANLSKVMLEKLKETYEGTRLGRQELYAELLEDIAGALWTWDMIRTAHKKRTPPVTAMKRIVVSVDPSGSDGETGDMQGIIVAGRDNENHNHVLKDASMRESPDGWGREVRKLYRLYRADRVVAERNYGGAMVESVIKTQDRDIPVKLVTATRGKIVRAEPVAALYEQGKVSHYSPMPELEEQMTQMTGDGFKGHGSPDRVDALVWALSELALGGMEARKVGVTV